jgi:hypothetical protein
MPSRKVQVDPLTVREARVMLNAIELMLDIFRNSALRDTLKKNRGIGDLESAQAKLERALEGDAS